jgi:hypothetical protein
MVQASLYCLALHCIMLCCAVLCYLFDADLDPVDVFKPSHIPNEPWSVMLVEAPMGSLILNDVIATEDMSFMPLVVLFLPK